MKQDGSMLKNITEQIMNHRGISDSTLRSLVKKYVIERYAGLPHLEVTSQIGYLVCAMRRKEYTIRRFFEFYSIMGYNNVEMVITMTKDDREDTVVIDVDLNTSPRHYGTYLKEIVDKLNVKYSLSPTCLSGHLSRWVASKFPDMTSAEIEHKAGNIAKSLTHTTVSWKRLLDYLSLFDADSLSLQLKVEGDENFTPKLIIDTNKRIKDERRLRRVTKK